jgi:hypothetical protein
MGKTAGKEDNKASFMLVSYLGEINHHYAKDDNPSHIRPV